MKLLSPPSAVFQLGENEKNVSERNIRMEEINA